MKKNQYKVVGNKKTGYAVVAKTGGTEYDLIETRLDATAICSILNRGVGPEWDKVEPLLAKEKAKLAGFVRPSQK